MSVPMKDFHTTMRWPERAEGKSPVALISVHTFVFKSSTQRSCGKKKAYIKGMKHKTFQYILYIYSISTASIFGKFTL